MQPAPDALFIQWKREEGQGAQHLLGWQIIINSTGTAVLGGWLYPGGRKLGSQALQMLSQAALATDQSGMPSKKSVTPPK